MSGATTRNPIEGEVWKSSKGNLRIVAHLDDDGDDPYWVMYRRPPPASEEYMTVTIGAWHSWADQSQAVCVKKADRK